MKRRFALSQSQANRGKRSGFLEHLFGSRTRVKLLRLFLRHPGRPFFVRELSREVGSQLHAVRRELDRFTAIKLLRVGLPNEDPRHPKKKFYIMDSTAPLYSELSSLVTASQFFSEQDMVCELRALGRIAALYFCGTFTNESSAATDLLLVGRIDRGKLRALMERRSKEIGFDIRYTIMTPSEFKYRRDVADRFLLSILDGRHFLVYNSLPAEKTL